MENDSDSSHLEENDSKFFPKTSFPDTDEEMYTVMKDLINNHRTSLELLPINLSMALCRTAKEYLLTECIKTNRQPLKEYFNAPGLDTISALDKLKNVSESGVWDQNAKTFGVARCNTGNMNHFLFAYEISSTGFHLATDKQVVAEEDETMREVALSRLNKWRLKNNMDPVILDHDLCVEAEVEAKKIAENAEDKVDFINSFSGYLLRAADVIKQAKKTTNKLFCDSTSSFGIGSYTLRNKTVIVLKSGISQLSQTETVENNKFSHEGVQKLKELLKKDVNLDASLSDMARKELGSMFRDGYLDTYQSDLVAQCICFSGRGLKASDCIEKFYRHPNKYIKSSVDEVGIYKKNYDGTEFAMIIPLSPNLLESDSAFIRGSVNFISRWRDEKKIGGQVNNSLVLNSLAKMIAQSRFHRGVPSNNKSYFLGSLLSTKECVAKSCQFENSLLLTEGDVEFGIGRFVLGDMTALHYLIFKPTDDSSPLASTETEEDMFTNACLAIYRKRKVLGLSGLTIDLELCSKADRKAETASEKHCAECKPLVFHGTDLKVHECVEQEFQNSSSLFCDKEANCFGVGRYYGVGSMTIVFIVGTVERKETDENKMVE